MASTVMSSKSWLFHRRMAVADQFAEHVYAPIWLDAGPRPFEVRAVRSGSATALRVSHSSLTTKLRWVERCTTMRKVTFSDPVDGAGGRASIKLAYGSKANFGIRIKEIQFCWRHHVVEAPPLVLAARDGPAR